MAEMIADTQVRAGKVGQEMETDKVAQGVGDFVEG